jgi:DNA polymerase-3 subunit gamma/tau
LTQLVDLDFEPSRFHCGKPPFRPEIRYDVRVSYTVLARTWRPQQFGDLLGQDAVVQTLSNALSSDALGHAYLFSGLRGVGKTTAARLLAKAVNCAEGPTASPCDECVSCREITAGSSIDVVEIDGASNRKIEDVRELREMLRFHPTRDRFRVIIIDEVHMLTREAFNALLKSLEEPPPYILFVLATTERHKVPATILSRCQQLEFRPLSNQALRSHLENIASSEGFQLSSGAAETIAAAAQGSVRDALSLVDQLRAFAADSIDDEAVAAVLGVPSFEVTSGLVDDLANGRVAEALAAIRIELAAGHDAAILFSEIGRVMRATLHLAVDPALEPALTEDQKKALEPAAASLGSDAMTRMLGLWLEQEPMLRDASNRELALEVAALRLARWPAVQRVERWLASGGTTTAGGGEPTTSGGSPTATGGQTPPTTPATPSGPSGSMDASPSTLGEALWADHPRLAGAVDAARVDSDGSVVTLSFPAEAAALARYAGSDAVRPALEKACRRIHPGTVEVRVVSEQSEEDATLATNGLREEVMSDPGIELARSVIGGEIAAVRPDGGS